MPEITVLHSSDGYRAFLQVPPEMTRFPSCSELHSLLVRRGVIFGINEQILTQISSGKTREYRIEVARGVPPKPGIPGRIEILVDISGMGKPKVLSDGRVDHRDIGLLLNVRKGDSLARRIPPQPGTEGRTVFGKSIQAPPVADVSLQKGPGTVISPADPNLLIAELDGALIIDPSGCIEVRTEKVIRGDVDYSTGNVVFSGDLLILGTIRSGFAVDNKGSLKVSGNIEDAIVRCTGNLEVDGGVIGAGNGTIQSGGSIRARHAENFSITAEGDICIVESMLHCVVSSGGKVKSKLLVGGMVTAGEVYADTIGSTAETRTIVDIGRMQLLIQERYALLKRLGQITTELVSHKQQLFSLVRDGLDEHGMLSPEQEKRLDSLREKTVESISNSRFVQARIEEIEKLEHEQNFEPGIVAGTVFPNTLVKYGSGERLIMEKISNVRLFPGKS